MRIPIRSLTAFPCGSSTSASTAPGSVMPQRVVNHWPSARLIRMPAATSLGITWPPFTGLTGNPDADGAPEVALYLLVDLEVVQPLGDAPPGTGVNPVERPTNTAPASSMRCCKRRLRAGVRVRDAGEGQRGQGDETELAERRSPTSDLDQQGIALPSAGADRRQAETATRPAELVHERRHDPAARGADRMTRVRPRRR